MSRQSPIKKDLLRRVAGQSLSKKILSQLMDSLVLHVFFPFLIAFGILVGMTSVRFGIWVPGLFLAVFLIWGAVGFVLYHKVLEQTKNDTLGRDGEREVGQILDDCKSLGWRILHDFQTQDIGNIDHIVIAPQGVFTIETKTLCKKESAEQLVYDGVSLTTTAGRRLDAVKTNPLQQAECEAKFLKGFLYKLTGRSFPADPAPIVTYPGWFVRLHPQGYNAKVLVMNPSYMVKNISSKPVKLTQEDQVVIYEALCRSQRPV